MSDDTKACPVCGESIKAAAIKCRFCNTDLAAYSAAKVAETERTLFTGHPAVIYNFSQWVAVIVTLGIAYLFYWIQKKDLERLFPSATDTTRPSPKCCTSVLHPAPERGNRQVAVFWHSNLTEFWWRIRDSNPGPADYDSVALTG